MYKSMRTGLITILITFLLLLAACSSSEEAKTVKAFQEAVNSHNVEAVMDFYYDAITINMGGISNNIDKEQMRQLAEWDSTVNAYVEFGIIDVSGDTVVCTKAESNDWFELFGIDTVYFDPWTFIFKEGQIRTIKSQLTTRSAIGMQKAMQEFTAWAAKTRPVVLDILMPEGQPVYGPETAQQWRDLLREWRQATGKAEIK